MIVYSADHAVSEGRDNEEEIDWSHRKTGRICIEPKTAIGVVQRGMAEEGKGSSHSQGKGNR